MDARAAQDDTLYRCLDLVLAHKEALFGHLRLADALREAANWVLSYDNCPVIAELYAGAPGHAISALYRVNQRKSKCLTGRELVIVPGPNGRRPRRKRFL